MSFLDYIQNVPNPPDVPSNDVPDMKINTNSIYTWAAIDHHGYEDNLGGYHKVIRQDAQGSTPANIPNINQIFVKSYLPPFSGATADTQLYALTGNGGLSQLTGNDAETDGWQWIGGVLLQWGNVPPPAPTSGSFVSGTAKGTVTFLNRGPTSKGIPFPNACFVVIPTPFWTTTPPSTSGSGTVSINTATLSATKFDWSFNSPSSAYTGFAWIAIGY